MKKLIYGLMEQQRERERLKAKLAGELQSLQQQFVSTLQKFIVEGRAAGLHGLADGKEEAIGRTNLYKFTLNGIPVLVACPASIHYWDGSADEYPPCKRPSSQGSVATREGDGQCPLAGKLFVYLGNDIGDEHRPAFESQILISPDGELFTGRESEVSPWVYDKNAGEAAALNVIKYCYANTIGWVSKPSFQAQKQGLLAKVNLMGRDELITEPPQPAK